MRGRRVKRRIDIKNAHRESMKKIEGAMTIKLDEIRRRVYVVLCLDLQDLADQR